MIELKKEKLLHYFPYRVTEQRVENNTSISDVLTHFGSVLSMVLNSKTDIPADTELKLLDLQADVSGRQKKFKEMLDEPTEDIVKRNREFQEGIQALCSNHVKPEVLSNYPDGNVPFSVSDDPKEFKSAVDNLKSEFSDLLEYKESRQKKFNNKMEGISKVTLTNTEEFTKGELKAVSGDVKKIVRLMLEED